MSDPIEWLRVILDEDREKLAGSGDLGWLTFRDSDRGMLYTTAACRGRDGTWVVNGNVMGRYSSATVISYERERLAEVDAKRRILDEHAVVDAGESWEHCRVCRDRQRHDAADAPCMTLRLLALPYADRPGYLDEWRP